MDRAILRGQIEWQKCKFEITDYCWSEESWALETCVCNWFVTAGHAHYLSLLNEKQTEQSNGKAMSKDVINIIWCWQLLWELICPRWHHRYIIAILQVALYSHVAIQNIILWQWGPFSSTKYCETYVLLCNFFKTVKFTAIYINLFCL